MTDHPVSPGTRTFQDKHVYLLSLGCSKNLVDGEYMSEACRKAGLRLTEDPERAEVIIVNTCGFIESAKQESIGAILDMADFKTKGTCELLLATGCLSERYAEEMRDSLPEVDAILGIRNYKDIVPAIADFYQEQEASSVDELEGADQAEEKFLSKIYRSGTRQDVLAHVTGHRTPSTKHYAYLKIAEGCSNHCAFCAIPGIRGPFRSRPVDEVLGEARELAAAGYDELIVIAQDSGFYGLDTERRRLLPELLDQLCEIDGLRWIRVLYLYAEGLTDELLSVYKRRPQLVPYFDIPIQHASDKILQAMDRRETESSLRQTIERLREEVPGVIIRTTVMTGFPGETEEDFQKLLRFVEEIRFDYLGCFTYSPEEGTKAATMPDQLPQKVKETRRDLIMETQQSISREKHERYLGKILEVKIEGVSPDGIYHQGRSAGQTPDVDPCILVLNSTDKEPIEGHVYPVRIVEADSYELTGVLE